MEQIFSEKKASIIRQYPLETLVLIITAACIFLTVWQFRTADKVDTLQSEMKNYLHEDRKILIETIGKSTEAVNQNSEIMKEVKQILNNKNLTTN